MTGVGADWPETPAEAFAVADWRTVRPKLRAYARKCLRVVGWTGLQPGDLVGKAIDQLLARERAWVPGTGATEDSLVAFLCATMRSIAVNHRTSAAVARRAGGDSVDQQCDNGPSAEQQVEARWLLARILRALEDDAEALAVCRALCEGLTRGDEIAEALRGTMDHAEGCTADHVEVVLRRIRRRLTSKGITLHDDHEGGQPSSRP